MARPSEFDRTKAVEQAMHVFWCQGYEATSIEDLTRSIGIKPGSLYNAFKDKHTLFLEALDYYQAHVGRCAFEPLHQPEAGKAAIRAVFANLLNETLQDEQRRGCFMLNATLELASQDEAVRVRAREAVEGGENLFLRALQHEQANGNLPPYADIRAMASYFMAAVNGLRTFGKANPDPTALAGIVRVTLSVLD